MNKIKWPAEVFIGFVNRFKDWMSIIMNDTKISDKTRKWLEFFFPSIDLMVYGLIPAIFVRICSFDKILNLITTIYIIYFFVLICIAVSIRFCFLR